MSVPRMSAVETAADALHSVYCLPGTRPTASWSPEHRAQDRRRAGQLVRMLIESGRMLLADGDVLPDEYVAPAGGLSEDFVAVPA